MASSEGSFLGFAKQVDQATENTTDAAFKYLLFREGAIGPQNMIIPIDQEVGGGALPRGMVKVGIMSAGQLGIIPRPATLGMFLMGALGKWELASGDGTTTPYTHEFTLDPADHFDAPYYTARFAPGNLWGEIYPAVRFSGLSLEWRGANFLRGSVAMQGAGVPKMNQVMTNWDALDYVDGGPQFLAPVSSIQVPTGDQIKVLSGAFTAGMQMPLDQQWIVGSYSPDAMDITSRMFAIQLNVKITSADLYTKMMYDPSSGSATAWVADVFREADILLDFKSDQNVLGTDPYELKIEANGGDAASGYSNVIWTAQLNALRPGQQVTMTINGLFTGNPPGTPANTDPIKVTLVNDVAAY